MWWRQDNTGHSIYKRDNDLIIYYYTICSFLQEKSENRSHIPASSHQTSISADSNYTRSPLSSESSPPSLRNSILRYVVLASNQVISPEDTAVTQSGNCFLLNRVHSSCKTELHLLQCRHVKQENFSSKLYKKKLLLFASRDTSGHLKDCRSISLLNVRSIFHFREFSLINRIICGMNIACGSTITHINTPQGQNSKSVISPGGITILICPVITRLKCSHTQMSFWPHCRNRLWVFLFTYHIQRCKILE